MEWYLNVVKNNYVNFKGRARRKEYWMFVLINMFIQAALSMLDLLLNTMFLSGIYSLVIILPSLAVLVRRLHDSGKSGLNFLWVFTGIGAFYVLYLLILEGDVGMNKYGADPKGDENQDPFSNDAEVVNPFSGENNPFRKN